MVARVSAVIYAAVAITVGPVLGLREETEAIEKLRRSRDGTLDVRPVSPDPDQDYAVALQRVQLAMGHLDEGLPNGQLARVEAAMDILVRGAAELQAFLDRARTRAAQGQEAES